MFVFADFVHYQNVVFMIPKHHIQAWCLAYSHADWDDLRDHSRDVPCEDIFKLSASATVSELCEWVQVGIDIYLSLIVSIRSDFTHFHGF